MIGHLGKFLMPLSDQTRPQFIYKNRAVAIFLAVAGLLLPGLHKFYLRQYLWGCLYLLLGVLLPAWGIARVASIIEGVWYLLQGQGAFDAHFNPQFKALPVCPAQDA